jgi:hypothetical protein
MPHSFIANVPFKWSPIVAANVDIAGSDPFMARAGELQGLSKENESLSWCQESEGNNNRGFIYNELRNK